METNSRPEKEVSTSKQGQYRPRRKDTTPKVNPQLAVELVYQELKRVEAQHYREYYEYVSVKKRWCVKKYPCYSYLQQGVNVILGDYDIPYPKLISEFCCN
ncbi:hypothetical protein NXW91_00010 [Bacteroides fragilis]|nr:hypothetical protein [Bacteroides fragilis]